MLVVDPAVLADPARLAAVERTERALPAMAMPLDAIARLSARLLDAPMAAVTLVGANEEFLAGTHALPERMTSQGRLTLDQSVCKYTVSANLAIGVEDMTDGAEPALAEHLLTLQYGIRAFLSVPIRGGDRAVGSLTVLDVVARHWSEANTATLLDVVSLLRPAAEAVPAAPEIAALDSASLLDSVHEAFVAVRPDGVVAGINDAAEQLLGYRRPEICGRHVDDTLLPDYGGEPIGAALGRLFAAAPAPVRRQVWLRHRDGHRLCAEVSLSVVRGNAGALACVFLTDQSRRQAAEDRAEDNDGFLTALLNSLSVGVVGCDADGTVVLMNRASRQVHGLPETGDLPADYPDRMDGIMFDTERRPITWAQTPIMRARAGEPVYDTDIVIAAPGTRARTFAVTALPIVGHRGRGLGAVAVSHEVTAVRRVERFRTCHREVESVLKAAGSAAEAAPGVLKVIATTLGWPAAELFLINETTGHLRAVGHYNGFDTPPDDFFGHIPIKGAGITGRVWQTARAVWIAEIADFTHASSAFERQRADICIRHGVHTVLAVPVCDGGTLLGVLTCYAGAPEHLEDLLTVLLDGVAAQIGVYVALRQAEELTRQLTRAQDDFITLAGHELRTPLTAIAAHSAILHEDSAHLDPVLRQTAEAIARNADTLQILVNRLLELAGLESGHLPLTIRPADLAQIARTAIAAAGGRIANHGVRVRDEMPDRLPVDGDAHRLRQLIDDLLNNAVTYSPSGGTIRIRAAAQGDAVRLTIADEGIGTPADERERVFDRFYRARNVRHQGSAGNGLGLSLARAIVRLHHGTIRLDGNSPTGTTVVVQLPGRQHLDAG